MNLRSWWMLNDWKVEKIVKSVLRAIWGFLTSPGLWIIIMVLFGLGIIAGGVLTFDRFCKAGATTDGWCGIVGKQFPWTVITGIATVPAVILTWYWRDKHKRRDIQIAQDGQVTERFTRAIEQLGSAKLAVRLGAIFALERIAKDSPRDLWTIIETLAGFIRESSPLPEDTPKDHPTGIVVVHRYGEMHPQPVQDVQAALTVLGRLPRVGDSGRHYYINLRNTDLRGADLFHTNLSRVIFTGSDLSFAGLIEANLTGSILNEVSLHGAQLSNSILDAAHFYGASLLGARGLTKKQFNKANIYENTDLPSEFDDLKRISVEIPFIANENDADTQ